MADIQPFRAWRYADLYYPHLADLLTPPYDVISPAMQADFYEKHPKNLCRIDFGQEKPGDGADENKYTRSATRWAEWTEAGTIVQDAKPAIYAYEQEFDLPGRGRRKRRGFFCAVKIEDFSEGSGIRAHEHTFAGPKADRLNLTRATGCNMSPIFCIYDDAARTADHIIGQEIHGQTPVETTIDGIIHRLWVIDHPQSVDAIVAAMQAQRLYIADGHHRYETSINYRREQVAATGKNGGNEPFDYTLMFLANTHDEGLEIMPTHRVFSSDALKGRDADSVLKDLAASFDITELPIDVSNPEKAAVELTPKLEAAGKDSLAYGLILPGRKPLLLKLKAGADPVKLIPDAKLAPALKKLDVTMLHQYMIHQVWLGSPKEELDDAQVSYVKDMGDAIALVNAGGQAAGFVLNPTKIEQVIEIAGLGMRMPHKSTYFYPKIITGMVIRDMHRP